MKTRFRFLAALLALFAFSTSFAEQVWAAACDPVAEGPAHHATPSHADGHAGHAPAPGRAPAAEDGCPLQAVAAGCALLSFPAPVTEAAEPPAEPRARILPEPHPSRELLLAAGPFRPPQR